MFDAQKADGGAEVAVQAVAEATQGSHQRPKGQMVQISASGAEPMHLESGNPNVGVEIGEINVPDGAKLDIKSDGKFEVGEINVGTAQMDDDPFDQTESNVNMSAIGLILMVMIVLTVVGILAWRALSDQKTD